MHVTHRYQRGQRSGCEVQRINTLEELEHALKADFSRYDTAKDMEHEGIRLDTAVSKIAQAIKQGDRSAVVLGYSLLMEDPHLPFGKILKSNLARALKHHIELLTEHEKLAWQTRRLDCSACRFVRARSRITADLLRGWAIRSQMKSSPCPDQSMKKLRHSCGISANLSQRRHSG